ncbi:MAG: efflux RND transporter periplasmic adaptor subunit [Pirellulales bacterium]|nr:efflux RND transporter periplasmic adaptor subunit [Pirellulales bacterium]
MNRRTWRPWGVVVLLACAHVAGCNRQQGPPQPSTPEVAIVTIQPRPVVLTTELPGRTSALLVAEIRPQVSGLLQKRLFEEGTNVKAGETLYQIDPAPYQAACDSASANVVAAKESLDRARLTLEASRASLRRHRAMLKLTQANLKRYEQLVKTQAASAMQRDQAETDVEVAEATLRTAEAQVNSDAEAVNVAAAAIKQSEAALETTKINLGYTRITAPISGRIGRSTVTEGAIVTGYQPLALATIQQLDPIFVDVPQSTAELNRLRRSLTSGGLKGSGTDKVKIVLQDGTVYPLEGSLKFRDVTVDPTTGSVILRIVVPNPEAMLLPGMFVQAIVEEGIREQAVLVPQQAVMRDPKGNPYVLIVQTETDEKTEEVKDIVQQRGISTDRTLGDQWLVSSGLDAGDRVVVEGMQRVQQLQRMSPDVAVKAVPFQAVRASAAAKPGDEAVKPKTAAKPQDTARTTPH